MPLLSGLKGNSVDDLRERENKTKGTFSYLTNYGCLSENLFNIYKLSVILTKNKNPNRKEKMFVINDKSNYFEDNLSESPIERLFLEEIVKYLEIGTEIRQQVEYLTKIGKFRVDFLIKRGNIEFVVELDGKQFHNLKNDTWRDCFLLGENKVKSIIRIKGKDITYSLNECLYFLSKIFPETFSERGKLNLSTLLEIENKKSIDENLQHNDFISVDKFYLPIIEFENDEIKTYPSIEIIFKNSKNFKYWKKHYDFAIKKNIYNIEELNKRYFN